MADKLRDLLIRNSISSEFFEDMAYKTLKLSLFENICRLLKDDENKSKIRTNLRNSHNKVLFVKKIVFDTCGCHLSNSESKEFLIWLDAYFRKRDIRRQYSIEKREELLVRQKLKCNICKVSINKSNSELDHIIPWTYVGDELPDNLQLLCSDCNRRKGKSINFGFSMFLLNSNE